MIHYLQQVLRLEIREALPTGVAGSIKVLPGKDLVQDYRSFIAEIDIDPLSVQELERNGEYSSGCCTEPRRRGSGRYWDKVPHIPKG